MGPIRIVLLSFLMIFAAACGSEKGVPGSGGGGGGDNGQTEQSFIYTGETDITAANQSSFELKGNCSEGADGIELRASLLLNIDCEDGKWSKTVDLSYLPNGSFEVSITDGTIDADLIFKKNTLKSDAQAVYEFEDASDLGKDSRAAHNAQTVVNVTAVNDVERGNVIQFNGTDSSVQLSDGNFMNDAFTKRTVSLWFKTSDITTQQMLYEEGGATNGLAIRIENEEMTVATRAGGDDTQENIVVSLDDRDTEWNHVAVTFDSGALKVYLNGVVTEKTVAYSSVPSHGNDGGIGASHDNSSAFGSSNAPQVFNGLLDDVMTFESALEESAVKILAEQEVVAIELDPLVLNLAAHYDFSDSGDMGVDSMESHDAASVAGLVQEDDEEQGLSARFDGSTSSMQLNDGSFLNDAFKKKTVAMWVKPDDVFADAILYDEGGSTNAMTVWIEDAFLFAAVRINKSTQTTLVMDIAELEDDWMHVAAAYDEGEFHLYVNGDSVVSRTASFDEVISHSDSGGIGRRYGSDAASVSGDAVFAGLIDDVRIYDRAVSALEIGFLAD